MLFRSTELNLQYMLINNVDQGSHIRLGQTVQIGLANYAKKTQGFGQQGADGVTIRGASHLLDDRDLSDSNRRKGARP